MTNLRKLKDDRDTCYIMACAAYGQMFVNALMHEGDDLDDELSERIEEVRRTIKPIQYLELVANKPPTRRTTGASVASDTSACAEGLWHEDGFNSIYE